MYIQNLIISIPAVLTGFLLSRLSMNFVGHITQSMGIVLDAGKVYSLEFVIIFAAVVVTFMPMMIGVKKTLKGGVIDEK